jgi:hypothetical protein
MIGSPRRCGTGTGTISSSKVPFFCASAARPCDIAANASCSSREMFLIFVYVSVAAPIPSSSNAQNSASCMVESTSSPLPRR